MARSRRLGIVGEVSVGPDSEVHKKSAGVTKPVFFGNPVLFSPSPFFLEIPFFFGNPVFLQEFGRAFSLLEKRVVVEFPI